MLLTRWHGPYDPEVCRVVPAKIESHPDIDDCWFVRSDNHEPQSAHPTPRHWFRIHIGFAAPGIKGHSDDWLLCWGSEFLEYNRYI